MPKKWNHCGAFCSCTHIEILWFLIKKQLIKYFLFKIILEVMNIFGLFKIYVLSSKKKRVSVAKRKKITPLLRKRKYGKENFNRKDIRKEFIGKRELTFSTQRW